LDWDAKLQLHFKDFDIFFTYWLDYMADVVGNQCHQMSRAHGVTDTYKLLAECGVTDT
jgi:hypothetical protein